jgi:hypothetical protein
VYKLYIGIIMAVAGGSWNDYPGGPDGDFWGNDYSSGGGFWGNGDFGGGYQQNYGGGPDRGGFGFGGGRPGPYSGLLHVLIVYLYLFAHCTEM